MWRKERETFLKWGLFRFLCTFYTQMFTVHTVKCFCWLPFRFILLLCSWCHCLWNININSVSFIDAFSVLWNKQFVIACDISTNVMVMLSTNAIIFIMVTVIPQSGSIKIKGCFTIIKLFYWCGKNKIWYER